MHLLLTDRLICPRCGPDFGLILLAHRMEARRVVEGELGCPNCRERYPIRGGVGDLRFPPGQPRQAASGETEAPDPGEAMRLAATLDLGGGPGTVALVGATAAHAGALAELVGDIEVVVVGPAAAAVQAASGVSRIVSGTRIPFHSRTLRGVALGGTESAGALPEAVRVLAPLGRLVRVGAGPGERARLEDAGLDVILEEEGTLVAVRK